MWDDASKDIQFKTKKARLQTLQWKKSSEFLEGMGNYWNSDFDDNFIDLNDMFADLDEELVMALGSLKGYIKDT